MRSWARPSHFAAILLAALMLAGAGESTLAAVRGLSTFDLAAEETAVFAADASAASLDERAAPGSPAAIDLPLGAQRHLHRLPYGAAIESVAERHGVDPLLIAAVVEAESNFRVDAVSPKGALGLMQVMPVHLEDDVEPFDPEANLELGAGLLADLSARFDGKLELALAAYHAGPGAVERFGGVPPYRSTARYIERVLAIYLEHYSQIVAGS